MATKKDHHLITIGRRPCKIGSSVNTRSEKHGDEDVPACDIPLDGIMLEAEELNTLLADPGAHRALFSKPRNGAPQEPMFKQLKPFVLVDKFTGSVELTLAGQVVLELEDVTLARVRIEPQVGGLTMLSLQVQCAPPVEDMAHVIGFLNSTADVSITFGKRVEKAARKQKDLELGFGSDGEHPDPDALNEAPMTH